MEIDLLPSPDMRDAAYGVWDTGCGMRDAGNTRSDQGRVDCSGVPG
ncbi:MAG: hypothetical protein ACO363_04500 [Balneolaceae bacterium]